jgi:DNA-binding response OmpR family regulator
MERKGVAVFGDIRIDFDRMEIRHSGRIVAATAHEFRLLKFFVDNPGFVFTREELLGAVWPERKRVNGRTVDNSIAHLRQKIETDPSRPVYFQTVHGVGYKFEPGTPRERPRDARDILRATTKGDALLGAVHGKSKP